MNLSPTTYGKSPAAMYLVRELNKLNNKVVARKVGKAITGTQTATLDIIGAYEGMLMKPGTAANCLRLMRQEVADSCVVDPSHAISYSQFSDLELILDLTRNLQIATIKRGMELCTLARKAERVIATRHRRVNGVVSYSNSMCNEKVFMFTDPTSGKEYEAGSESTYTTLDDKERSYAAVNVFTLEDMEDKTPVLVERSKRRIARRGLNFNE